LQAADLLAAQKHVQDVSSALAARLFAADPRCPKENNLICASQVGLCTPEKRPLFLVVDFSEIISLFEETASVLKLCRRNGDWKKLRTGFRENKDTMSVRFLTLSSNVD
jgi:hypothetical protein